MSNHYKTRKQKVLFVLECIGTAFCGILIIGFITCVFLYGAGVFNV